MPLIDDLLDLSPSPDPLPRNRVTAVNSRIYSDFAFDDRYFQNFPDRAKVGAFDFDSDDDLFNELPGVKPVSNRRLINEEIAYPLSENFDQRLWRPSKNLGSVSVEGPYYSLSVPRATFVPEWPYKPSKIRTSPKKVGFTVPRLSSRIGFKRAHKIIPCVRRWVRREVLFARRVAGGAGIKRKHKWTKFSYIDC